MIPFSKNSHQDTSQTEAQKQSVHKANKQSRQAQFKNNSRTIQEQFKRQIPVTRENVVASP